MGLKGSTVFVTLQAQISALGSFGLAGARRGFFPVRLLQEGSEGLTYLILCRRVLNERGVGAGAGVVWYRSNSKACIASAHRA